MGPRRWRPNRRWPKPNFSSLFVLTKGRASQMRVCGLPVLSAASLSETERGAGGADTADPSSTATAAQPMRVGSAASAAGAPAQTTPSDCKLGANLSGNALGEDVNVETTRVLQLDPASTARTANAGPALPRGAGISALRHIDANNSAFNMLNEAGAAAALTPNEVVAQHPAAL